MKIVCKKDTDLRKMLELVKTLLETESLQYPILENDLILEFSLKNKAGESCPENIKELCLDETDLETVKSDKNLLEYYYNTDALTKLFNRGQYERDIISFQTNQYKSFTCIYIDAVGLHEINNHLGHAAGDCMLCSIANGIRKYFSAHPAYRIGGDEFVIFCFDVKESELVCSIAELKSLLALEDYEISVGIKTGLLQGNQMTPSFKGNSLFMEIINKAEHAMRQDKTQFYNKNGAKRQMRSLNYKLEKILLEKQDATQFLNAIASEYKGVYTVNPEKDTCRNIYVPEYFERILEENNGIFSTSMHVYCKTLVLEEDQALFHSVFDYNYVLQQLRLGHPMEFSYRKKNGEIIHLQITLYDPCSVHSNEMLWIFMNGGNSI